MNGEAYQVLCQSIVTLVNKNEYDMILLDLHGAMVTEFSDDGEGDLLVNINHVLFNKTLKQDKLNIRKKKKTPIGVVFDLHGKLTPEIVNNCDCLISFKTYPHIDMKESGIHLCQVMFSTFFNLKLNIKSYNDKSIANDSFISNHCEFELKISYKVLPLMINTLCSRTHGDGIYAQAIRMAKKYENQSNNIVAVSVLAGFSLSDIKRPCVSVLVVERVNVQLESVLKGQDALHEITHFIWENRHLMMYSSETLADSIRQAKLFNQSDEEGHTNSINKCVDNESKSHVKEGPVVLLDYGDNVMSGGTADTMAVLNECLKQGLQDIVVGPINDPEAVAMMTKSYEERDLNQDDVFNENTEMTINIGDKIALPSTFPIKSSTEYHGTVSQVSDGIITITGPTYTGLEIHMGPTVLFVNNKLKYKMIVTSTPQEHFDFSMFKHVGIDIENDQEIKYLILKSRMYCRPVFGPLSKAMLNVDSEGVTTGNYDLFNYSKLIRPVYPFDLDMEYASMKMTDHGAAEETI